MVLIGDVMRFCRNYFERAYIDGVFTISGGTISPIDGITDGQYIAVQGSTMNDGVYLCTGGRLDDGVYLCTGGRLDDGNDDAEFTNETFSGRIWLLAPPKAFVRIASEIAAFEEKNPTGGMKSETFGEYSYQKSTGKSGAAISWQEAYATQLRGYMRLFTYVGV